jgi:1-acyl-sn-glycerol-3-phosphate acyltransferase
VAALYKTLNVPVIPVALDSGLYWPRRSFKKQPGTITIHFLEPIPPGLDRQAFMRLLEDRTETACNQLLEARSVDLKGRMWGR